MKSLKSSLVFSFITITLIYLLANALGIFIYCILNLDIWLKLLIADVVATVFVFIFSLIFKNASVYDPYWSVQPMAILIALAITKPLNVYSILLLVVVLFWGARLTANWAYTFKDLTNQDWRYTMLKEKTGKFYPVINFIGIHLVPTLVVYACILPAVYAFYAMPQINVGGALFIILSFFAVILQGAADIQMHAYKKAKKEGSATDTFIRIGLWKNARHPNYLAEILMWWGVGLSVVCVLPSLWYLLIGAFVNTLLFAFVSIPMAERKQSKKDGYLEYKTSTRILLPISKKIK